MAIPVKVAGMLKVSRNQVPIFLRTNPNRRRGLQVRPYFFDFLARKHGMNAHATGFVTAVVDDDQSVLESLEGLLESAGHGVRAFASAVALLESGTLADIDCLISDIDMPEIDGLELARLANATRPGLPVILITGHHGIADPSNVIGAVHYRLFKKPFDGEELLTAVNDAVQRSRS